MIPAHVRDVVLDCRQQGVGVAEGGKQERRSLRERTLDQRLVMPCANPECRKGGFILWRHLKPMWESRHEHGEVDIPCAGAVGPNRSERGPAPRCGNTLAVAATTVYAPL